MAYTKIDERMDKLDRATQSALGKALQAWDYVVDDRFRGEVTVTGLSMKESRTSDEWLVVIRGLSQEDGGPMVGFHAALTPSEALAGAAERVRSGSIKWRVDEYGTKNGEGTV